MLKAYVNHSKYNTNLYSQHQKQEKKVTCPWEFFKDVQDSDLCDIDFNESDIIEALKELQNSAAPGPDNFPAIVLKMCSKELVKPLYILLRT